MRKRSEVCVNGAIVAIVLFAVVPFIGVLATITVFLTSSFWMVQYYLDRCHYCGSRRVSVQEDWQPGELPGWNEVVGYRICKKCGVEEVNHYSLRDMNPLHPSPYS